MAIVRSYHGAPVWQPPTPRAVQAQLSLAVWLVNIAREAWAERGAAAVGRHHHMPYLQESMLTPEMHLHTLTLQAHPGPTLGPGLEGWRAEAALQCLCSLAMSIWVQMVKL